MLLQIPFSILLFFILQRPEKLLFLLIPDPIFTLYNITEWNTIMYIIVKKLLLN